MMRINEIMIDPFWDVGMSIRKDKNLKNSALRP